MSVTSRGAAILWLTLGVLAVRVVYLVWFCRYELVGDEALYWVWSRHLELSYTTKGPGVAWVIAASTRLLGDAEWAVRLPVAVAAVVSMLTLGRLATECSGDALAPLRAGRAGLIAATLFCLVPGYFGMSQLMTIDGPYVACWILSLWIWWRIDRRMRDGGSAARLWMALGATLGIGFLFKYTILLLVPGLIGYAVTRRREWKWTRAATVQVAAGVAVFVACISPVLIWNHRHGWPTLAHLLGHLGVTGHDHIRKAAKPWSYNPMWLVEMIASQLGIIGPALALMWLAAKRGGKEHSAVQSMMIWAGVPVLAFYTITSFRTDVEGNWMLAGYASLLVLAAQLVARGAGRGWWRATVVYGLAAAVAVMFPTLVARVPGVGRFVPVYRISGAHELAGRVHEVMTEVRTRVGAEPLVIASSYQPASLLTYYLPEHPYVFSANYWLGGRWSSQDLFEDADLTAAKLQGRSAVLVGATTGRWEQALRFQRLESVDEQRRIWIGTDFGGPASL